MPDTAPEPVVAPPPPEPPVEVWRAVLAAQKAVQPVAKADTAEVKNKEGRTLYTYKFASTEDMMQAAREALLAAGLIPQRTHYTVRNGIMGHEVVSYFRLVHVESGQAETFEPIAMPITGRNAADKLLAGALTFAWSYWLRDVLCIPRQDENSPDRRKEEDHFQASAPPREGTRRVTKPAGRQNSGRPQNSGRQGNGGQGKTPPSPPAEDPRAADEARTAMVKAAKALVAACDKVGGEAASVDIFKIAGEAVYGEGKRWRQEDHHTIDAYNRGREEFERRLAELQEHADEPVEDEVPDVCGVCGMAGGMHEPGCPEVADPDVQASESHDDAGEGPPK